MLAKCHNRYSLADGTPRAGGDDAEMLDAELVRAKDALHVLRGRADELTAAETDAHARFQHDESGAHGYESWMNIFAPHSIECHDQVLPTVLKGYFIFIRAVQRWDLNIIAIVS